MINPPPFPKKSCLKKINFLKFILMEHKKLSFLPYNITHLWPSALRTQKEEVQGFIADYLA